MTQTTETTVGADAPRPTRRIAFLSVVLAIGFVALIGVSLYFVVKSYRPTLFRDQWDELKFLFDIKNGTFTFSELFSQASEHRPFTGRLLFLIDAFWFGFSNIFLLTTIFVSHLLLGGLIAFLWFDRSYDVRLRAAACIGGAATMVTIVQYENLTWGESIVWAHTYSFALLALLALGTAGLQVQNIRRWLFLGLYVVFYALSAFTQANGLLVPGAAVVLIVFQRGRWLDVIVVVAAALIVSAFYIHGYYAPGLYPLAEQFTRAPSALQYLLYLCHLLAAPWITDPTGRALLGAAGIGLLMLVMVAAIWDIRARRPLPLAPAVLTCLAGFTFVSATLISIGRASFGLWHAGESRYATPSLVFWLSIAGVVYWLFIERLNLVRTAQARKIFAITLLAFLLAQVIRIDASDDTQRALSERILAIDRGSIALINNSYLTEGVGLENLYFPQAIKGRAAQLRAYGWSIFSPRQNTYAPPIHLLAGLPAKDIPICRGYVDAVTRLDSQRLALRGWLLAPTIAQTPSWIFVRDQLEGIAGYFIPLDDRSDLVATLGPSVNKGYFAAVDFKRPIPSGKLKISFVAVFDVVAERICTFTSEIEVPTYEITSDYGELPGRPIAGLQAATLGRVVTQQSRQAQFPALPLQGAELFSVAPPSDKPAGVTFRFDASVLGSDDLAIPVAAITTSQFPIEIVGPSGPIDTLTLNTFLYGGWKFWRLAIIPRGRLPAQGEITVTVHFPGEIPQSDATIAPPFATPANPNRAALY